MPKGFFRVAAASVPVHLGDVQANVQQILSAMEQLRKQGVQAAVFPQLCLTGATLGDLYTRPALQRAAWRGLETVARKTNRMAVVVGLPVMWKGQLYNCAAVCHGGAVQGLIPQMNTAGTPFASGKSLFEEMEISSGECLLTPDMLFAMGDIRFGVELGQDGCSLPPRSSGLAQAGADVVLHLSDDAAQTGRQRSREEWMRRQSAALHMGYVYAGAGFGESTGDHVYDGATLVCEDGDVLAQGERYSMQGGAAIADVDVDALRSRRQQDVNFRRAPDTDLCSHELIGMTEAMLPLRRVVDPLPFVPKDDAGLEEIVQIQCTGLATRLRAIQGQHVVIGVSGGLDSTLALLVAARTFDQLGLSRAGIHAITMPGMGTGARTKGNADRLMQALGVSASEISIAPAVRQHFADIGHPEDQHDVTYENAQARERTQILMDYANRVGGIVLGTGDLSEEALGFCTYNGDHMSMYNVNCTVTKTCLRSLTRYLSAHSFGAEVAAICQDVVDTPVSPELLPAAEGELNQRTEDILGDYALHDFYLYHFMRDGADGERLKLLAQCAFGAAYSPDQLDKQLSTFWSRFRTQQFKRSCAPDGPQTGPVSLSPRGGWAMPGDLGKME